MKRDLYSEVSARIVAELERGAAPWVKPWSATAGANTPCNAVTNRPYSGCNVVLLWMAQSAGYRTPRYLTFKQALELGGNVRKGMHGYTVFFVKQLQVRDKDGDDGDTKIVPMMREYTVFNVDQCEGLPYRVLTLGTIVRSPCPKSSKCAAWIRTNFSSCARAIGTRLRNARAARPLTECRTGSHPPLRRWPRNVNADIVRTRQLSIFRAFR
jgi:antirestriction protein ArdC